MAGGALAPLARLTEVARAIGRSRDLSRRVTVPLHLDELGRLAETFNEMLASLHGAVEAQRRFVADASHELRAPLTAIQGNLELLRRYPGMPEGDHEEALIGAEREAARLGRLVADLLALARSDAGVPMRRERVELDELALEALREARHMSSGLTLEVGALEPLALEGDRDGLKQLLLILLDNAVQYTPPGGRVRLEVRRSTDLAELTVSDTGVGIGPEHLGRVFERFYRADPARGRRGGSGLGLAIAEAIVNGHGGRIRLESRVGTGTTARVELPLDPAASRQGGSSAQPQFSR